MIGLAYDVGGVDRHVFRHLSLEDARGANRERSGRLAAGILFHSMIVACDSSFCHFLSGHVKAVRGRCICTGPSSARISMHVGMRMIWATLGRGVSAIKCIMPRPQ
jgi:hypothetical protein